MAFSGAIGRKTRLAELTLAAVHVAALASLAGWFWLGLPRDVAAMEQVVAEHWPDVGHLSRPDLEHRLTADGDRTVLFDVRTEAEHAVSHLAGAIPVDPDIIAEAFVSRYGAGLAGKTVVFYCSVGVRSSRLALRVQDELERLGAVAVHDLSGGLFGWHDDGRALVDAGGPVDVVHGFSWRWSRLLERRALVRMPPVGP